jgi:tetratricopeptide (TPR) repeat protein
MARAAAKSRKRAQPDARRPAPRTSGRRNLSPAEQALFFTRIRTHAKWAFVLLVLVFAGGFVFFGVGSGSNSAGSLGDLFNNIFNGSSGPSISKYLKETEKHPNDAKAWKNLATAYSGKGRVADAINAWTTYVSLRPKDADALTELGSLQVQQAQTYASQAASAQSQQPFDATVFAPPSTTKLGQALGSDPIQQAVQTQASTAVSTAQSQATAAYQQAVTTYQELAKLTPNDGNIQVLLARTAESAQNYKVAIAAYEKAAKLLPDQAAQLRRLVKQLRTLAPASG